MAYGDQDAGHTQHHPSANSHTLPNPYTRPNLHTQTLTRLLGTMEIAVMCELCGGVILSEIVEQQR